MPTSEIWNSWQVIPQNAIERKMTTIEPCRAKLMQKFYLKIPQFDSMHLSDLLAVLSFFGLFWWHLKSPELSWEILVYPHQPKRSYILTPAVSPPNPTMTSISLWILCVPLPFVLPCWSLCFLLCPSRFCVCNNPVVIGTGSTVRLPSEFCDLRIEVVEVAFISGVPCFCRCSSWDRQNSFVCLDFETCMPIHASFTHLYTYCAAHLETYVPKHTLLIHLHVSRDIHA